MSNIKAIESPEDKRLKSVKEARADAEAENFVWVIIVGVRANGKIMTLGSRTDDGLKELGALGWAASELTDTMKGR